MLLRGKSKERSSTRKVTPPEPSYMNNDQFATFLSNLRENRVNRPGGARPQPSISSTTRRESDRASLSRPSLGGASVHSEASTSHQRTNSDTARQYSSRPSVAGSISSRYSTMSGRDYYPERPTKMSPLKPDEVVPSATYMERGTRWMEKEEAVSLRTALEDMDLKEGSTEEARDEPKDDAEARLYNAALNEAAELVWQHQNGIKPPEPGAPYRYKPHMRKNSYAHARTASVGRYGDDIVPTGLARDGARSVSGSSSGSEGRPSLDSSRPSMDGQRQVSGGSTTSKSYGSLGSRSSGGGGRRRSSMKRNISGEIQKPFSGDQIWEEPEGDTSKSKLSDRDPVEATQPLRLKLRNPPNKVQFAPEATPPETGNVSQAAASSTATKPLSRVEIYKNPPSQSRNPAYTVNNQKPAGPRVNDSVPKKNGIEIRSDDIRQATSYKLGDRSKKLPTPSAVSDRPGRPIVSFDAKWKAPEEAAADTKPELTEQPGRFSFGARQSRPTTGDQPQSQSDSQAATRPTIPTLSFTPDVQTSTPSVPRPSAAGATSIPSISVDAPDNNRPRPDIPVFSVTSDDGPSIPSIVLPGDDDAPSVPIIITPGDDNNNKSTGSKSSARPLPTPTKAGPHMRNSRGGPRPRGHWSPAPGQVSSRATAICHECASPIEGRFVALNGSSERFHPQCFSCYTCGTSLEALEISPEPDSFRSARLDRIARRAAGEMLPEELGQTMAEDGDSRLRFYCHLDWHELYAPRCKTCTTPIIGEHIVALGQHFHYGHFFCAECGDPFQQGMTHIEKDGYAWCVNCQTKRTERRAPKCKRCKKAVIGQYVQALGGEWHDECFRCGSCGGGFDDGQIFPVGDGVRCTDCRMRELKA